jgi:hypothetical protein
VCSSTASTRTGTGIRGATTSAGACTSTRARVEAQSLAVATRGRDHAADAGIHGGAATGHAHGRDLQRLDPVTQPRRQDLLQLGQGPQRDLLDAGHCGARGHPQPDRDGDGLVVVEQQRRERGTRAQPVAASDARPGVHRISEGAQPLHIVADGPGRHPESLGELGPRPVPSCLQQREQAEQACRGLQHFSRLPRFEELNVPQFVLRCRP